MRITDCKGTAAVGLLLAVALGSRAQAQGLGEITLDSALNEPLRAHIELLDTENLDESQIGVALASQSEFDVAGIDSNMLLGSLRFSVVKANDGDDRIEITSTQNITEPYLNFLLSVTWPNGRSLREYTLLLDLPMYNDTAGGARTPEAPVANRVPAGSPTTAPATAVQSATADGGYVVQRGDSLYRIAEQNRPSGDVSVQQMMLAIQRANEDAFVNNNINRILTGKVLRIPTAAEIALIDQAAASAQVAAQNQQLVSQPLAVNDSTANTAAPVRDELTLLSGDQSGGGSGDLDATIAALENELMLSEENLDRARLENLELTNRLAALQEQIDLLQNIIAIEDERIAQLQSELSTQSAATEQALNAADSAAQAAGSGLVEMLKNSVVALGALLAVAAAAAGLLYMKRRRSEMLELDGAGDIPQLDPEDIQPAGKAGLATMLSTLLARFRRSDNDESDNDANAEAETVDPGARIEPVVVEAVVPPPAPAAPEQSETDKLLSEIGITDEFLNLNTVLDDVDNEVSSAEQPAVVVDVSSADAEATAALAEVDLLDQALTEAEQQDPEELQEEEDFLRAPAAAAPAPESFAFTIEPVSSETEPVAEEVPAEDKPDVFEFTLPNLDEPARGPVEDAPQEKQLETFAFTTDTLATVSASAADDSQDALEVLSFDEDSVVMDDAPEELGYTPAGPQDTHDARLDLAVAYEAMGDIDGAVEILDEVIASGRPTQVAEAERLKQKWQNG